MALTTRNLLQIDAIACACYSIKFFAFPDWYLENSLLLRDNSVRILRMWGLGVQPGLAALKWIVAHSTDEETVKKVGLLSSFWSLLGAASFYLFLPSTPLTLAQTGLFALMGALYGYTSCFGPRIMKKI
eukprot:TRINITY_DN14520_c0_g1_i1.p1 TRINITY_DN14520_c0_g1~~TRINITY_DN14520_c0_g1_i1.p1  ORF type:complete len:129 (+),score=32.12 TRINITY_DN14520_c0_g1_i1:29-415(+)